MSHKEFEEFILGGNLDKLYLKFDKAVSELEDVFLKNANFKYKIYYDFLSKMLKENPFLLDWERDFYNVIFFLNNYNKFAIKIASPPFYLLQIEEYFVEKYCLLETERILISFIGVVRCDEVYFRNRVIITNYRIIILGNFSPHRDGSRILSCASDVKRLRKPSKDFLQPFFLNSKLKDNALNNVLQFGFHLPILYPKEIAFIDNTICFTSYLEGPYYSFMDYEIFVLRHDEKDWKEIALRIKKIIMGLQKK